MEKDPIVENEDVEDEEEMELKQSYEQAVKLFECLSCMTASDEKIRICKSLKKQFKEFKDYEDASDYIDKCEELIAKIDKEQINESYKTALAHMDAATTSQEYERVIREFDELGDYEESVAKKEVCEKKRKELYKSTNRKIKLGCIGAVIVLLLLVSLKTSFGKYYEAKALRKVTLYERAGSVYNSLGTYKDSKHRYKECEYQLGLECKESENYSKAMTAFRAAGKYKDSEDLLVEMQKQVFAAKKIGSKVKVGDCKWIIIGKEEDRVLLIKETVVKQIVYSEDPTKVSWETSNANAWLNKEFSDEHFSTAEASNIVVDKEQTKADSKLFVLSKDELEKYPAAPLKSSTNQWLRDTVTNSGNVVFLNTNGVVMESGYSADSDQFSVRPAFWYSIK